MNRHLRKFIEDANDAYPENTEAATKQVKSEIKTLSATNEMTAKSMERELIEAGIKSLIDQERSRAKAVVKFTPQPISSQPNSSYTPRPANPPSNAIGSLTVAKNIMDDWFIGRGSNRTTLGAATRTVLEHEIDTESGITKPYMQVQRQIKWRITFTNKAKRMLLEML